MPGWLLAASGLHLSLATQKNKTKLKLRWLCSISLFVLLPSLLAAQYNIVFHHINTLNGLSDNNVTNATLDKHGFLWICTTEGLNRYDGRQIINYYKEEVPELRSNNIREVVCDNKNRLWIRTFGGFVTMLDEQRKWKAIKIVDSGLPTRIYNVIETKSRGMVLFNGKKQFVSVPGNDLEFTAWHFATDTVFDQGLFFHSQLSDDEVVWTGTDEFFIMNYRSGKVTYRKKFPGITSAEAFSNNIIYLTTSEKGGLYEYNLETGATRDLRNLSDQFGRPILSSLQKVRKINDRLIITSEFAGLYVYEPSTGRLYNFKHDPLKSRSVSGNSYHNVITDTSGYVMITSPTNGLSYFNINDRPATWVSAVTDREGNIFDGYVNAVLPADEPGVFWLGCYNQLIKWNRKTGKGVFFDYGTGKDELPNKGNEEVTTLCKDADGYIWVGTARSGIVLLNAKGKLLTQFDDYNSVLEANSINYLLHHRDTVWISTSSGISMADARKNRIVPMPPKSELNLMLQNDCGMLWKDSRNRLWIGSPKDGAYRYDPAQNKIKNFLKSTDGTSVEVFAFEEDHKGNIYLGTRMGLVVIDPQDRIINTYTKANGLRGDQCENLIKDENGNIWIDNHNAIAKFNPVTGSFTVYDEKSGLSSLGFRPKSAFRDDNGFLYFGSEKGFSAFHPDSISEPKSNLKLAVIFLETSDSSFAITSPDRMQLSSNQNNIVFHFTAIDLDQSKKIIYRYRLRGHDHEWTTEPNIRNVRYNGLSPGKYIFEVQASVNSDKWVDPAFPVRVAIAPALWQRNWFRFAAAFLLAMLFYAALKQRERLIHRKAREKAKMEEIRSQALQYQLEIEQVINYFANALIGLHTVEEILWDVVKTCISQLGFQDCVVYLYNEDKSLLVQRAAFGPKNIDYKEIYNRIELEPGSGIVGHVALTGTAEIISDTSKDPRYVPDDAYRLSEIAIPLIGSNGVIGVIDSEHPEPNFYSNRHLQILTAIAAMVVNKAEQIEAEADSRRKEVEMARLQRDIANLQLTATRAQMNPHFIFNTLNSVQQYILQGNTDEANKYLSRFSRLQREILNHCDRPFITLQKEIDMLQMYLELEQLRFNGSFEFEISFDEETDAEEIKIPPMILQPFVENAIWHGLMPKEGTRTVYLSFETDEDKLRCIITDNGIGRQASAELKQRAAKPGRHLSKGLSLVYKRLDVLQEQTGHPFKSFIRDLVDKDGNSAGTEVEVILFIG